MDLSFTINNTEDIDYLQQMNHSNDKKNEILRSALSIGLRSIQMSETNMDCQSYLNPLNSILLDTSNKMEDLDQKLNSFLHLQSNSSKKGELSENICRKLLAKKYTEWEFNDVSNESYSGDCRALETPIGEILYEFKNYDTNVNREQVLKFHRDLEYTGINYGIFVSNTSGIVGKKSVEWEIIQKNKIVIYVSNLGYNGYGCIVGTELLLALIKLNILDASKMYFYQNYELNELKENLSLLTDQYQTNLEGLTKHKFLIKEQKHKINLCMESLEKSIFDIELNQKSIFQKIFTIISSIDTQNNSLTQIHLSTDLEHLPPVVQKCSELFLTNHYHVFLDQNEVFYKKNDILCAFTKHRKSKIELIFPIQNEICSIHLKYEKIKNNEIIIELKDNHLLFDIISERIK
jgi:hypothetical protein